MVVSTRWISCRWLVVVKNC